MALGSFIDVPANPDNADRFYSSRNLKEMFADHKLALCTVALIYNFVNSKSHRL